MSPGNGVREGPYSLRTSEGNSVRLLTGDLALFQEMFVFNFEHYRRSGLIALKAPQPSL
jgi:hypothetical protein